MKMKRKNIKSLRKFYESEMVKDKIIPDNILYDKAKNQRDFLENTVFPGMDLMPAERELFGVDEIGVEIPKEFKHALWYGGVKNPIAYWTDEDVIIIKNEKGSYYFYEADDYEGWLDEDETVQDFMYSLSELWHWGGSTDKWDYKREEIEEGREYDRQLDEWEDEDWEDNGYVWNDEQNRWILKESRNLKKRKIR